VKEQLPKIEETIRKLLPELDSFVQKVAVKNV
jgi:hypothetical protein